MNSVAQTNCELICEDKKHALDASAITVLADLQLAVVGGGCGDVLWG